MPDPTPEQREAKRLSKYVVVSSPSKGAILAYDFMDVVRLFERIAALEARWEKVPLTIRMQIEEYGDV